MDFVDNLEKVGDHLTNIAQGVMSGLRWGEKYRIQEHAAGLGFLRL
jgi:phosphate uptake regulator